MLCELVRKRERLKRDRVTILEKEFLKRYHPVRSVAGDLLDKFQAVDFEQVFAEPVRVDQ